MNNIRYTPSIRPTTPSIRPTTTEEEIFQQNDAEVASQPFARFEPIINNIYEYPLVQRIQIIRVEKQIDLYSSQIEYRSKGVLEGSEKLKALRNKTAPQDALGNSLITWRESELQGLEADILKLEEKQHQLLRHLEKIRIQKQPIRFMPKERNRKV